MVKVLSFVQIKVVLTTEAWRNGDSTEGKFSFFAGQKKKHHAAARQCFYKINLLIPDLRTGTLKFNKSPILQLSRRK